MEKRCSFIQFAVTWNCLNYLITLINQSHVWRQRMTTQEYVFLIHIITAGCWECWGEQTSTSSPSTTRMCQTTPADSPPPPSSCQHSMSVLDVICSWSSWALYPAGVQVQQRRLMSDDWGTQWLGGKHKYGRYYNVSHLYYYLRSIPVSPNEWPSHWVTKSPSDWVTDWPSDWVTEWPSDWVTKSPSDQVTKWPSDWVTEWLNDQMTK